MLDSFPIQEQENSDSGVAEPVLSIRSMGLTLYDRVVLDDINFDLLKGEVLCLLGAQESGKSLIMRCLNRTAEEQSGAHQTGNIYLNDRDLMDPTWDLPHIRRAVALVPEVPNPFLMTAWENIAYVLRLHRLAKTKADIDVYVETALRRVGVWADVKDRLHTDAVHRLDPMIQRLVCVARALVLEPKVLLLGEPTVAAGGIDFPRLNRLLADLKVDIPVLMTTPSLNVAAHVSDRVAHIDSGSLLEIDATELVLTAPQNNTTRHFVSSHC